MGVVIRLWDFKGVSDSVKLSAATCLCGFAVGLFRRGRENGIALMQNEAERKKFELMSRMIKGSL